MRRRRGVDDAVGGVVDDLVPDHVRRRPLDADAGAAAVRDDVLRLHEAGAVVRAGRAQAADVGRVALRVDVDAVAAVAARGVRLRFEADEGAVDRGAVSVRDDDAVLRGDDRRPRDAAVRPFDADAVAAVGADVAALHPVGVAAQDDAVAAGVADREAAHARHDAVEDEGRRRRAGGGEGDGEVGVDEDLLGGLDRRDRVDRAGDVEDDLVRAAAVVGLVDRPPQRAGAVVVEVRDVKHARPRRGGGGEDDGGGDQSAAHHASAES